MDVERLPLATTWLCTLIVDVGPIVSLGHGPYGERRVVELLGGRVDGPDDVLARLARGDDVDPSSYFFRTFVRFQTGAARLAALNRTMAVAVGRRRSAHVELTLHAVR